MAERHGEPEATKHASGACGSLVKVRSLFTCVRANDVEGLRLLLEGGANVYSVLNGVLPIYWAISKGHDECAVLLSKYMKAGDLVSRSNTCLSLAYNCNRVYLFDYFLKKESLHVMKEVYYLHKHVYRSHLVEKVLACAREKVCRYKVLRMMPQFEQILNRDVLSCLVKFI